MTTEGLFGVAFLLLFAGLMVVYAAAGGKRAAETLRYIPGYTRLRRHFGLALEAGARLHFSLGRGNITGQASAITFAGLALLRQAGKELAVGDHPPVVTAGEGASALMGRDSLYQAAQEAEVRPDPAAGRLAGVTPFSYAAGAMLTSLDEPITANVLLGSFGPEAGLICDAARQAGGLTIGGTDNLTGMAVMYAAASEALIGEEAFAAGAYFGGGRMQLASVKAQDALRWSLIILIILGVGLKLGGVL